MVVVFVFAVLWLGFRVAAVCNMVTRGPDQKSRSGDHLKARPGPRDAVDGPQDAPFGPQDAAPADLAQPRQGESVFPSWTVEPTLAVVAAICRDVTQGVRKVAAGRRMTSADVARGNGSLVLAGEPSREWLAALRETISDTVVRPDTGPACLGGRDDAAYLRGWDDAVAWIGQGHDAEAPTWAGVAYMTGWNDAIRDVARARQCAERWPSPATTCPM